MSQQNGSDPLAVVRKMWSSMGFSLPGMVVPTFDADELEKRITDLKAVEGWLSMNLSMLQMTIQSLEMQTTTIRAVQAMGEMASNSASASAQAMKDAVGAVSASAAAEVPATEKTPATEAAGEAAGEGQGWPWGLMQQVQEYMQRQTAAAAEVAAAATEPMRDATEESPKKKGRK